MEHGTTRACAYCKQDKAWIWGGKKLKDGSKIYTDENDMRWSGRRCPECERARVYAAVRCDGFERDIVLKQFEESGYTVVSRSLPLKVMKDGKVLTVGIKRALADQGKIVLETPVDAGSDIVALVFESVRICTPDQLARLQDNVSFYKPQTEAAPQAAMAADSKPLTADSSQPTAEGSPAVTSSAGLSGELYP